MFNPPGDLGFGRWRKLQFVENVARDTRVAVRAEQPVEQRAGIVRARRVQFLMARLQTESRRNRGKSRVEGRQLRFDTRFLLAVGEYLPHAIARGVGRVREPEFVVLVVGGAGPEPDGRDRRRIRPEFSLCGDLGLVGINAGLVIGAVEAGDVIERVVLRDRRANKPAMKNVRAADRCPIRLRG